LAARFLVQYLAYSHDGDHEVILVDGDAFEQKNRKRQVFSALGNKTQVLARDLSQCFPAIRLIPITEYVTLENVSEIIEEGDIVFLAVDNHATRKCVSDHCKTLGEVSLFSCGNELTDGNIQIYLRKGGVDLTPPLDNDAHSEIQHPEDSIPERAECEVERESEPQLLFTNLTAATLTLNAFLEWRTRGRLEYCEVYFDITTNETRPVMVTERR